MKSDKVINTGARIPSDSMILCITGMPGAGKTLAADFLRDERRFKIVEMGDVVRDAMTEKGLKINNVSIREFALKLREEHGEDAVAKMVVDRVKKAGSNVVITGVRSINEIDYFRQAVRDISVIGIIAPRDVRYVRLRNRGRQDDLKTMDEFEFREEKEKRYGVLGAIDAADYVITNTGTLEELKSNILGVLELIRKGS